MRKLVAMVRSLRSLLILDNITINAIAPGATVTKLLPSHLAEAVRAIGAPISTAHTVALALVHSATAKEPRRVEDYGKDKAEEREGERRWNGRTIVVLGDQYTEVEEKYADLRSAWLGETNTKLFQESTSCDGWKTARRAESPAGLKGVAKVRKRLETVSHFSLNRLVQFSLRHLANRAVWFRRSTPRFARIVYRYLNTRRVAISNQDVVRLFTKFDAKSNRDFVK